MPLRAPRLADTRSQAHLSNTHAQHQLHKTAPTNGHGTVLAQLDVTRGLTSTKQTYHISMTHLCCKQAGRDHLPDA